MKDFTYCVMMMCSFMRMVVLIKKPALNMCPSIIIRSCLASPRKKLKCVLESWTRSIDDLSKPDGYFAFHAEIDHMITIMHKGNKYMSGLLHSPACMYEMK